MSRIIELVEEDGGKLSFSRVLALYTTIFISCLIFAAMAGLVIDYTLIAILTGGYAPYTGKEVGAAITGRISEAKT